uniref:Uncharacterized protein n=1 Tax=Caenorhabditis japonica TaxID=281687 RepID=A0A8R1IRH9_CAEJA
MFLQAEPIFDILPGYNPAIRTSTGLVDETTSAGDIFMEEETVVDQTESTRDILPGYNPAIRMSSDPVEVQSPAADLSTLNKTIKNLTEPFKERPLPSNVEVLDTYPFQSWYRGHVKKKRMKEAAKPRTLPTTLLLVKFTIQPKPQKHTPSLEACPEPKPSVALTPF